ncbi:MAG: hypothetical protein ACYS0C_04045 [Planctomycetota bacterium]|jgi:hypothetical protein
MAESKACYRKLRKYKYQLMQDYTIPIEIELGEDVDTNFIALTTTGVLTVKNRYAWDGPSGPTIDTRSFMRGSLVHDALYQLMRGKYLDYKKHRKYADELLKNICLKDGMFKFRAWYVYQIVCMFGEKNARPSEEPQDEIICVP